MSEPTANTSPSWIPTTIDELQQRLARGEWPRVRVLFDAPESGDEQCKQGRLTAIRDARHIHGETWLLDHIAEVDGEESCVYLGRRAAQIWVWAVPKIVSDVDGWPSTLPRLLCINAHTREIDVLGVRFDILVIDNGASEEMIAQCRSRISKYGQVIDRRTPEPTSVEIKEFAIPPRLLPKPAVAGPRSAALWELAQILGQSMYNGARPLLERNVITVELKGEVGDVEREALKPSHRAYTLTSETLALARRAAILVNDRGLLDALRHAEGISAADLRNLAVFAREAALQGQVGGPDDRSSAIEIADRIQMHLAIDEMPVGSVEVCAATSRHEKVAIERARLGLAVDIEATRRAVASSRAKNIDVVHADLVEPLLAEIDSLRAQLARLEHAPEGQSITVAQLQLGLRRVDNASRGEDPWIENPIAESTPDINGLVSRVQALWLANLQAGDLERRLERIEGEHDRIATELGLQHSTADAILAEIRRRAAKVDREPFEIGPFVVSVPPADDDGDVMLAIDEVRPDGVGRVFAIIRDGDTWSSWGTNLARGLSDALKRIEAIADGKPGREPSPGIIGACPAALLVERISDQFDSFRSLAERTHEIVGQLAACEALIRRGFDRLREVDPDFVEALRKHGD